MNKKGIVQALEVLIVVAIVLGVIFSLSTSSMQGLLGLDLSEAFSTERAEFYNDSDQVELAVANSVNALTYAINRLAAYNTYMTDAEIYAQKYDPKIEKFKKIYPAGATEDFEDAVTAKPTFYDRETIYIPPGKDAGPTVAKKTINCWEIFHDKGNADTRCFLFEDSKADSQVESEEDLLQALFDYGNSSACGTHCKEKVADLLGSDDGLIEHGFFGAIWNELVADTFNVQNVEWLVESCTSDDWWECAIRACADDDAINEVHYTRDENYCETPLEGQAFGFKVKQFYLPNEEVTQKGALDVIASMGESIYNTANELAFGADEGTIPTGTQSIAQNAIYSVETFLKANGDPDYILFYEKFPEGEDEYWQADAFEVGWKMLFLVEGLFFLIDLIPFGGKAISWGIKKIIGVKPIKWVLEKLMQPPIEKLMKTWLGKGAKGLGGKIKDTAIVIKNFISDFIDGIKKMLGVPVKAAKGLAKGIFRLSGRVAEKVFIRRAVAKEALEGVVDKILVARFKRYGIKESERELFQSLRHEAVEAWNRVEGKLGSKFYDRWGRISPDALSELGGQFDKVLDRSLKIVDADTAVRNLRTEFGHQITDMDAAERTLREKISKQNAAVKKMRSKLTVNAKQTKQLDKYAKKIDDLAKRQQKELAELLKKSPPVKQTKIDKLRDKHTKQIKNLDKKYAKSLRGLPNEETLSMQLRRDLLQAVQDSTLRRPARWSTFHFRSARQALDRIRAFVAKDITKEEQAILLARLLKDSTDGMKNIKPQDLRKLLENHREAVDMLWNSHRGTIDWSLGGLVPEHAVDKEIMQHLSKRKPWYALEGEKDALTRNMDQLLKDVDFQDVLGKDAVGIIEQTLYKSQGYGKYAKNWALEKKKRHMIAVTAAVLAMKMQSIQEKLQPVGTNVIGLKMPYWYTIPYGKVWGIPSGYTDFSEEERLDWLNEYFFKNYGLDRRYIGLLPEVETFYLSLIKDKHWFSVPLAGWKPFEQDPQRFHLVSPCKADILLRVTRCDCFGEEEEASDGVNVFGLFTMFDQKAIYTSGKLYTNVNFGKDAHGEDNIVKLMRHDFTFEGDDSKTSNVQLGWESDGTTPIKEYLSNQMLYEIEPGHVDSEGKPHAIKTCPSSGMFEYSPTFKPKCITINPVQATYDDVMDPNYCYHGLSVGLSVLDGLLNWVLPITASILGAAPWVPVPNFFGSAVYGALAGVAGGVTYEVIAAGHNWPEHS